MHVIYAILITSFLLLVEGASRFLVAKRKFCSKSAVDAFTKLPALLESIDLTLANSKQVATQISALTKTDPLLNEVVGMLPHSPKADERLPSELTKAFWKPSDFKSSFIAKVDEIVKCIWMYLEVLGR